MASGSSSLLGTRAGRRGKTKGLRGGSQGFMFAQQRALLSRSNIPQLSPRVLARKERGHRDRDNARALLEGEWEWNVGAQALIPTQAS